MLLLSPGWASSSEEDSSSPKIWLTVNARRQYLEVSWQNAPVQEGDHVVVTKQDPTSLEKRILASVVGKEDSVDVDSNALKLGLTVSARRHFLEVSWKNVPVESGDLVVLAREDSTCNKTVATIRPTSSEQWFTTTVPFDYALSQNVTIQTTCYGFWASYIDKKGSILAQTCLRAYPVWMNELKLSIGGKRLRDLLIPGTHDAGAYEIGFNPLTDENISNKYTLCQDDDIRGQLMHGARYLDMRVAYYETSENKFFINHGTKKIRPLQEVIDQVKTFVQETNEIVIFGLKEFPVGRLNMLAIYELSNIRCTLGFGSTLEVHELLVDYLRQQFNDMIVDPALTWAATLDDIWAQGKNIILAYDLDVMVTLNPDLLFTSVMQKWGNVRTWSDLEQYLRDINKDDVSRLSDRPVADMAELTPTDWDVVTDGFGGLRKMADNINRKISELYREELGVTANIVAADFIRGTTLMDIALEYNQQQIDTV
ncbi:hypothetical protein KR018_005256 [Drosophila ironensis]|nr:hypothetical protein KR018_005256 [Drosophila ironensis]